MKLGRSTKTTEKAKCVVRKWHIVDKEVNLKYQNALRAEVS